MRFLPILIVLLIVSFACRSNEKNSDVKHKAGAIVEDEKSWAHLEVSTESFIRYKNDASYWKKIVPYDEDSEIYRFISMDLQMLDNAVREKFPVSFDNVPKPTLIIADGDEQNAFVSSFPVCYNNTVIFGGIVSWGEVDFVTYDFSRDTLSHSFLGGYEKHCVEGSQGNLEGFISAFNKRAVNCKIKAKKKKVHFSGRGCQKAGLAFVKGAKKLILLQAANKLILFKGLIQNVSSRAELLTVMAHELAHYYKAHENSFKEEYGFFYDASKATHKGFLPVPSFQSTGEKLSSASEFLEAASEIDFRRFGKINSQNYLAVGGLADLVSKHIESCQDAVALAKAEGTRSAMLDFPFETPNGQVFNDMGRALEKCLNEYERRLAEGEVGHDRISMNDAIFSSRFASNVLKYSSSSLDRYYQAFSKGKEAELDVLTFIANSEKIMAKQIDEAVKTHQVVFDRNLGWYTAEQEADEVGTEIMASLGIGKEPLLAWYESKLDSTSPEKFWGDLITSNADCKELYNNGFLDSNGNEVRIPIGSFTNEHHSACYRLYNLTKEVRDHNYNIPQLSEEQRSRLETAERSFEQARSYLK